MGANNCCGARSGPDDMDLPWNPIAASNAFQGFEVSLPFHCTRIDAFEKRTRAVALDGGVTIEQLRFALTAPEWKDLKEDDSRICEVLKHYVFYKEEGIIDLDTLLCFALLNCPGSGQQKANVLYNLLQEGGAGAEESISWADKDYTPIMNKVLSLASIDLARLCKDIDDVEPMEDVLKREDDISASFEQIREDIFIEFVYGNDSRLEAEKWKKIVASEKIADWLFNPQMVRALIFDKTGIQNTDENVKLMYDVYSKRHGLSMSIEKVD